MNVSLNNIMVPQYKELLPNLVNLISQDMISVQPMKGPVGIPFAMNFAVTKHLPFDLMQHILTVGSILSTHTGDVSTARVIVERMGSIGQLVHFNAIIDVVGHDAF